MPEKKASILPPWPSYLFTLIALVALVTLVRVKSLADTATEEVQVQATDPVVDSVSCIDQNLVDIFADDFTPIEGSANDVTCTILLRDPNGCEDIASVSGAFRKAIIDFPCVTDDDNNCTSFSHDLAWIEANNGAGDDCDGAGDTQVTAVVTLPLYYFADSGMWTHTARVTDDGGRNHTVSNNFTINTLAAFQTGANINYGIVPLGDYSVDQTVVFTNTGNQNVDATVYATSSASDLSGDMTETSGNFDNIPAENVQYSMTPAFTWDTQGTEIASVSAPTAVDLNLLQQTTDYGGAQETASTYWRLLMPVSGVSGSYQNTLVFTADPY